MAEKCIVKRPNRMKITQEVADTLQYQAYIQGFLHSVWPLDNAFFSHFYSN